MTGEALLNTRPSGDGAPLTEALEARGYHVVHEPLTEIFLRHAERQALQRALLDEPDAVIVTSRHGAHAVALLTELRDMFLLCVGKATENAALSLGFTRTSSAGGNAASLIAAITGGYDPGTRFLYASGEHVRIDLAEALAASGMEVQRLALYEAMAAAQLSDTLVDQLQQGELDGVTFMSQRAAHIFDALAGRADVADCLARLHAFCLSAAVAAPLHGHLWRGIHVSGEATLASLAESVDNAFKING